MLGFFKKLFSKQEPAFKIWAYSSQHEPWVKIVSTKKPFADCLNRVVGPFRSEVDCEEFCDKANVQHPYAKKYINSSERSVSG